MSWKALSPVRDREAELNEFFCAWGPQVSTGQLTTNAHRYLIAGAPSWLPVDVHPVTNLQLTRREGRPDLVWETDEGCFVIELKSSYKGEPLALAQVLHYAHALARKQRSQSVTPVIVTQYNPWLRKSLSYLFDHGLQRNALRYVDFAILSLPGQRGQPSRRVISFGEPFADWVHIDQCPAELRLPLNNLKDKNVPPMNHWYFIEATATWIGLENSIESTYCPALMGQPYTAITRMQGGMYLLWSGTEEEDYLDSLWEPVASERSVSRVMSPRLVNPSEASYFQKELL